MINQLKHIISEIRLGLLKSDFVSIINEGIIGKWRKPVEADFIRAIKKRNYLGIYYNEPASSKVKSGFRLLEPHVYGIGFKHSKTGSISHEGEGYLRAFVIMNTQQDPLAKKKFPKDKGSSRKSVSASNAKPHWRMLKVDRIEKVINLEKTFKANRPLYNANDKNIANIKASV